MVLRASIVRAARVGGAALMEHADGYARACGEAQPWWDTLRAWSLAEQNSVSVAGTNAGQ
tara:strand:- start:235 stop:414 length:180 start_codon:yes stop_codon:yes gene_type:complete